MADAALIPVIVQDADSGRVLMLAYADEEALGKTRETGEAWFRSRSRNELWHKGATSGNTMAVEEIRDDCDGDALLYRVRPNGPACHTGAESCFAPWLWRRVAERAAERPEGSYVGALVAEGPAAAARKVGVKTAPAPGEMKVSLNALMGTTMTITNNSRFDYAYRAILVLPGGKVGPAKSCAVPAHGRLAIEHWKQTVAAVRLSDFKPAPAGSLCP